MDIQAEKLSLIQWITNVHEPSVIKKFLALKQKQESDWWDIISDEEKKEIEEGVAQIDAGDTLSHEEVMSKYQKWLTK